jgi:hypothetical protein
VHDSGTGVGVGAGVGVGVGTGVGVGVGAWVGVGLVPGSGVGVGDVPAIIGAVVEPLNAGTEQFPHPPPPHPAMDASVNSAPSR